MGRRKPKFLGWVFLMIVLFGGGYWYYYTHYSVGAVKFATAQAGTISHERMVMATFANQETPVVAPSSGSVQYICEDGQRVRRGDAVASLYPTGASPGQKTGSSLGKTISANAGGLFFKQTDGLETVVTSENLVSMDLEKLLTQTAEAKISGEVVQTGEFVGKIVNNLIPTQAFVELTSLEEVSVGKNIRLTVGGQTVNAKVLSKSEKPMGAVVEFPHYMDGSAATRRQEVAWVYQAPTTGVLIPRSALWTQGEEQGVFLWSEGIIHFKRVKILDQDEEYICVENLTNGVPVVITPRDGLEGLVANVKNI